MKFESTLPKGLYTATLTPLNNNLSVNYSALVEHMNWLLANGSTGICFMGTTGEANSFSVDERIAALEQVVKAGIDPKLLLVGTGTCALPDTIKLTRHAVELGAGGILMLPPFYYKGVSDSGLMDYFNMVVKGVNNPHLRIYLYHFPKMTGVPFTPELVKKLIHKFPGVVVGMKDSSGDWQGMETIMKDIPDFQLYAGTERYLLKTLQAGGPGCISATFNATIKLGAILYKNWENDSAATYQDDLTAARQKFEINSFVSGLKYLFAQWHNDPMWRNMRPPNALPDEAVARLLDENILRKELHWVP